MDPVFVIGVVSAALTFVDTTAKALKIAWTIYNSVEGSTEETELQSKLSQYTGDATQRLIPAPSQPALTDEDKALVRLAQDCNKLSNAMATELSKLKPKRRKSKIQSGFAALKTLSSKSKIEDLEKQCSLCHDQLHLQISCLASQNLKLLIAKSDEDGAKLTQLDDSIGQLKQALQGTRSTEVHSIGHQALEQLRQILTVGQDALGEVVHDRILRGVKSGFDNIHHRYETIDNPYGDTFEWIFDLNVPSPEAAKFTHWLSSGDGIFHIFGKLVSRKSTLMKRLYNHPQTRVELQKWTRAKGDKRLVMASFFFYALGSDPRQTSLIGLLRTLLYHILSENAALAKIVFPSQWTRALSQSRVNSTYEILDDDIKAAYELLANQSSGDITSDYCFCFFIDGLDEYQVTTSVDRRQLVRHLTSLSDSASCNFKICVSSRIENPFMDMFSDNSRFYLHLLTKTDMKEYVEGNLDSAGSTTECQRLASAITQKAECVFLWVVLVTQEIRKLSDDGARFSRLLNEIESLPSHMTELFQRTLGTLTPNDRVQFNHLVLILCFLECLPIVDGENLWIDLHDFYFLEDYESYKTFAEDDQSPEWQTGYTQEKQTRARKQLRAISKGLVDTRGKKPNDPYPDIHLSFIHRSVRDYLKQEDVWIALQDMQFSELEALSQLKLASLKQHWRDAVQDAMPKNAHEPSAGK
ncbi:hypothetical protein PG997_010037, partial [Apiospora hydei]